MTIDYYITSEMGSSDTSSLTGEDDIEKGSLDVPAEKRVIEIHQKSHNLGPGLFGRPVFSDIVPASLKSERTCVVRCGLKGMNQDLGNAVSACQKKVLSGEPQEVAFHTETFGW